MLGSTLFSEAFTVTTKITYCMYIGNIIKDTICTIF